MREAKAVLDDFSASTAEGATNADVEMLFEQLRSIEYGGLVAKVLVWSVPLMLGYLLAVGYTTALVGVELGGCAPGRLERGEIHCDTPQAARRRWWGRTCTATCSRCSASVACSPG